MVKIYVLVSNITFSLEVFDTIFGGQIMKLDVTRVDVWAANIKDRPGELARKLEALARAGANLEFGIARRTPKKPGTGVVFVTPIRGARQVRAARQAGFRKSKSLCALRIAAVDKPGLGVKLTQQIADTGVNLQGLYAATIGKRAVFYLAFDSTADASKAMRRLKAIC